MITDIATSIKYGNYKYLKSKAIKAMTLIDSKVDKLYSLLNLPSSIYIKLRPIRGAYTHGQTSYIEKGKKRVYVVELDARYHSKKELLNTLLHELVHVNQFHTSRLEFVNSEQFFWKNSFYDLSTKCIEYMDLPWEQEAFEQADILYEDLMAG